MFLDHMIAAKLSPFNNNWSRIHDFTGDKQAKPNFSLESYSANLIDFLESIKIDNSNASDDFIQSISCCQTNSMIPLTNFRKNKHQNVRERFTSKFTL